VVWPNSTLKAHVKWAGQRKKKECALQRGERRKSFFFFLSSLAVIFHVQERTKAFIIRSKTNLSFLLEAGAETHRGDPGAVVPGKKKKKIKYFFKKILLPPLPKKKNV
jgi:hypothetical protein